jgi:trk system potassium uptake protein TrkA
MRVVIAGAGSVGRFIAEQLVAGGSEVAIVDQDRSVVNRYRAAARLEGLTWIAGDACDVATLKQAGLGEADVVASVTGDDEDNLVISLLAKQEFAVPRVVARVNNPNNEWMFNEMWGVDVAVSTPHLLTGLVQEAVTVGSFVRLLSFEKGKASSPRSPRRRLAGHRQRGRRARLPPRCHRRRRRPPREADRPAATPSCAPATR